MQFPEKLIPLMITNCIEGFSLPIYGNGKNIRDWLHVNDHCDAISIILENGVIGECYNVGGNNELTNNQIVNEICEILDELHPQKNNLSYKKSIKYVDDRPGHDFRYAIDSSKIRRELGWKPKYDFS